jgi:hypothetical protein
MSKLTTLDPGFRPIVDKFLAEIAKAGIPVLVTAGRRTIAEQNVLYAQGRTKPGGIVTKAKGGQSPHNFGCAVDIVPLTGGKPDWRCDPAIWESLGVIGRACGLVWGGDFKSIRDRPHFESPTWRTLQAEWKRDQLTKSGSNPRDQIF